MKEPVEVLFSAGGSSAHMRNEKNDRSTGLTINRMKDCYFISVADLKNVWEIAAPISVAPLGKRSNYLYYSII